MKDQRSRISDQSSGILDLGSRISDIGSKTKDIWSRAEVNRCCCELPSDRAETQRKSLIKFGQCDISYMRYQGKVQELKSEACLTLVRLPRSPSATVKPFLDAIASPCSYPHQSVGQWVSEWVIDIFRCDATASPSFASLFELSA